MAASKQHYIPKLLLNGFLSRIGGEARKSQVRVLNLADGSEFVSSIKDVMAERRFNEFLLDEATSASIEDSATSIESHLAPVVYRIRKEKRLQRTPQEIRDLALLMAFQFLRTKKTRQMPEDLNRKIRDEVAQMGFNPDDVQGLNDFDEEALKRQHIRFQVLEFQEVFEAFADKEFFLMLAPLGSSFYIGDHPVVLHNDVDLGTLGMNLGLKVPYIQIYLPISAELLLCAYCPAVFGQLIIKRNAQIDETKSSALRALADGLITVAQMRQFIESVSEFDGSSDLLEKVRAGLPVEIGCNHVDFYNSLQVSQAARFVIDPNGQFRLALHMIADRMGARE